MGNEEVQKRKDKLKHCLIGWWGKGSSPGPGISTLYSWVTFNWPLTGEAKISQLGRAFL